MAGGEEKKAEAVRSSDRFICLRAIGHLGCEWYLMDLEKLKNMEKLNKEKKKKKKKKNTDECIVSPLLFYAERDAAACSVSMGTDFYFLGGNGKQVVEDNGYTYFTWGSRRALKFDATHPEQGFVEIPPMLNERCLALANAFKGKIYVFGGSSFRKEESFGECFDPKLQKWTPIDSPRVRKDRTRMIVIPYDDNHLLVGPFAAAADDDNCYWLYDVESNSWTVCPESPMLFDFCNWKSVQVGNTLYYRLEGRGCLDGDICALDLESGIHYRGPVKGRVIEGYIVVIDFFMTNLFHLGGDDFCYFTINRPAGPSRRPPSCFCCTKVRVVKLDAAYDDGDGYLDATIVSTLSIPIDKHVIRLIDTTPVDEIFVKTLLPDTGKAGGSGLLSHMGRCVLQIGVVALLSIVGAAIRGRVVQTGGKKCVARHAEGLHLDKQAVHKEVTAVDTLREESCGDNSIIYMCNFWNS